MTIFWIVFGTVCIAGLQTVSQYEGWSKGYVRFVAGLALLFMGMIGFNVACSGGIFTPCQ